MANLQETRVSNPKSLEIHVLCPGLEKDDLTLAYDKKTGTIDILGKPKKSNKSAKHIDLDIDGTVNVFNKYRSSKIEAKVANGVLIITTGLAENVSSIDVE